MKDLQANVAVTWRQLFIAIAGSPNGRAGRSVRRSGCAGSAATEANLLGLRAAFGLPFDHDKHWVPASIRTYDLMLLLR